MTVTPGEPAANGVGREAGLGPDTKRRLAITILLLLVYRLGCQVPIPGIDQSALSQIAEQDAGSGVLERTSIFALGIVPLLSAMVFLEALRLLIPPLARWHARDPRNAYTYARLTRLTGLAIALWQAVALSSAYEDVSGLVAEPGPAFRATCVATLLAATALVSWLADTITRRGLGSGLWILFLVPTLMGLAQACPQLAAAVATGQISLLRLIPLAGFLVLGTALIVALLRARPPVTDGLALVWPALLAFVTLGWLLVPLLPLLSAAQFDAVSAVLSPGHPVELAVLALLVLGWSRLWWRGSTLAPASRALDPSQRVRIAGSTLALVVVAGELLVGYSGLPLGLDGRVLAVLVATMLSLGPAPQRSLPHQDERV